MGRHKAPSKVWDALIKTREANDAQHRKVTIMRTGLWAVIFQRTQEPSALTRWCDLNEEIQEA